jgi:hypothetical protein
MMNRMTVEPLDHEAKKSSKHTLLIIAAGALCVGIAFIALALILASCSAAVSSVIKFDGSATISVEAEMPTAIAAKVRKLASAGAPSSSATQSPIFDVQAIRKDLGARPGIEILELSQPKPDAIRILLSVRDLKDLSATPDLEGSGLFTIDRGPTSTKCSFVLARGEAKALSTLFPGIDPGLLEALSPPALEEDPLSLDEYKTMLKSVLGEKAMPAMEGAAIRLSISAPGPVLASSGGTLSGSTLKATIPILDILALEKPIKMQLRWKNAN